MNKNKIEYQNVYILFDGGLTELIGKKIKLKLKLNLIQYKYYCILTLCI